MTYEQPGDLLLEQTDYLSEPQALGCQEAQTPEVLNGGGHPAQHSPSQQGVCAFGGLCEITVLSLFMKVCPGEFPSTADTFLS